MGILVLLIASYCLLFSKVIRPQNEIPLKQNLPLIPEEGNVLLYT